jgi:FG-GAP repeat
MDTRCPGQCVTRKIALNPGTVRRGRRTVLFMTTLLVAVLGAFALAPVGSAGAAPRVSLPPLLGATLAIQQAELTAKDAATSDEFGYSVAISGNNAVVGDFRPGSPGAAYVFVRAGGTWVQQSRLTPSVNTLDDHFGSAVAISGNTAMVGAYAGNGAVYIFAPNGIVWTQRQVLTASDAANGDGFGFSLAISNSSVIIGASGKNAGAGAAYVFVSTTGVWSQQQELTAADAAAADEFGHSVSLSGDTALVGAWHKTVLGQATAGAAYVFVRSGTSWAPQQELSLASPVTADALGTSVGVSSDTALVGAPGRDVGPTVNAGTAYVFVRSGTAWSQQAALTAGDAASNDLFGASVALDANSAVTGAPFHAVGSTGSAGVAYAFSRSGTAWSQTAEPTATNAVAGDEAGKSVAISGATVFMGAPFHAVSGLASAGAVYVFVFDVRPPLTVATGMPVGWSRTPVTVTLTATDDLSGVATTQYRLQGSPTWITYVVPFIVSSEGSSTYECQSIDLAGNAEAVHAFSVRVDTHGPQTLALAKVTVKKGKSATFRFRVSDLTPTASVSIKIFKGTKLKKALTVGSRATGSALSFKWKATLHKGGYTWKVFAKDLAGNTQSSIGSQKLTIK